MSKDFSAFPIDTNTWRRYINQGLTVIHDSNVFYIQEENGDVIIDTVTSYYDLDVWIEGYYAALGRMQKKNMLS